MHINGNGYTFKEPQVSEEKRLDIIVTYFQHQYVMELKRWDSEKAHQRGIQQLADYLNRRNLQKGCLLIFEYRTKKT
ncbi:MAG: GxxExxY protein [Bacteroidota bacterium]